MPHAKLTPDSATDLTAAAGDATALSLLRQHDYGRSWMDRAQRQLHAQNEVMARTQTQLQQPATTTLPQEAQLAALDRQTQQLADAERTQTGYRRLRERFDPDELDRSLQQIGAIADPVKQRESLTQLQGSYAGFAFNPELARRMDAQFAAFEPVVQRREGASLLAAIKTGRYAPTLADARQIYPGRKINPMLAPGS